MTLSNAQAESAPRNNVSTTTGSAEPLDAASSLRREHEELARGLRRLLDFVKGDDLACAREEWQELEAELLRHLDGEEMFLLPLFEEAHPEETTRLRREHADIRQRLGDLGVAFDLHTLRAEHIEELAALLTRHANTENASLYLWTSQAHGAPAVEAAARRLRPALLTETGATVAVLRALVRVCRDGERGPRSLNRPGALLGSR